jgi:hypothetical protein
LVYLLALLIPSSCTVLLWEFYFLPFSVHVQTNTIYVTLLSVMVGLLTVASISLLVCNGASFYCTCCCRANAAVVKPLIQTG